MLTDGGVYDNLGLETVWKRYETVLVSDAGGKLSPSPSPRRDWARHSMRVLDIIDNQVRSLRKRQVIDSFQERAAQAAPTGASAPTSPITSLPDALTAPHERTLELARTPTRLKRCSAPSYQERLINWGYAVCDAAVRKHFPQPGAQPPAGFPYPASGV